eukprot:1141056-Pelagomonas_calceolata.AAC.4
MPSPLPTAENKLWTLKHDHPSFSFSRGHTGCGALLTDARVSVGFLWPGLKSAVCSVAVAWVTLPRHSVMHWASTLQGGRPNTTETNAGLHGLPNRTAVGNGRRTERNCCGQRAKPGH